MEFTKTDTFAMTLGRMVYESMSNEKKEHIESTIREKIEEKMNEKKSESD